MDYEKLCNDVLMLDPGVRFVAVYDSDMKRIAGGIRNDIESYLPGELTQVSVDGAFARWNNRKNMRDWIGNPICAFAEYEKVKRFTFYLDKKRLLIVSAERRVDNEKITGKIFKVVS